MNQSAGQSGGQSGVTQHRYARRFFTAPVLGAVFGVLLCWVFFTTYDPGGLNNPNHPDEKDWEIFMTPVFGLLCIAVSIVGFHRALSVYETSAAGIRKAGSKRGWTAWNQIQSVTLIEKSETSIFIVIVVSMLTRRAAGGLGASSGVSRMVGAVTAAGFAAKDAMASKKITPGVKHRYFPRGRTWLWGGKYLRLEIKIPGKRLRMVLLSQISEFDAALAYAAKAGVEADEVTRHNFQALGLLPGGAADAAGANAAPQPA